MEMEIWVWILIGALISAEVYFYLYKRRTAEREKRLKDFILDDEKLRQLYLEYHKQKAKTSGQ